MFAGGGVPDDAPVHTCKEGEDSAPIAFLSASGLVASRGEARRLIGQNALSIDDAPRSDALAPLKKGQYVVKLGKKRFLRLTVE